jgi:hypothetical protein
MRRTSRYLKERMGSSGKLYEIAVGFEEFLNKIFRWK